MKANLVIFWAVSDTTVCFLICVGFTFSDLWLNLFPWPRDAIKEKQRATEERPEVGEGATPVVSEGTGDRKPRGPAVRADLACP